MIDELSYDNEIPPNNPFAQLGNKQVLTVQISIHDFELLQIDDIEENIEARFGLHLSWLDDRVTFSSLKPFQNTMLTRFDVKKLWIPQLIFEGPKNFFMTSRGNDLFVRAKGRFPLDYEDLSNLREAIIYEGFNTRLTSFKMYKNYFKCDFEFRWYPFDNQVCSIVIRLRQSQMDILQLHSDSDLILKGADESGKKVFSSFILSGS